MFKKIKIRKSFTIGFFSIILFSLIGFVEKKHAEKTFKNIIINIDQQYDNYFVLEEDVLALITQNDEEEIVDKKYDEINLKTLEQRVKSHRFVEDAQVFKDHEGNLMVEVQQCRPIARIIQTDGPHAYIGSNGNTLTTSEKFTARVLLIDGAYAWKLTDSGYLHTDEGMIYFDLLKTIDSDKFLKAQIAQLSINRYGEVTMYPQVGDQKIEIGIPVGLENKLKKLKIFYKEILPAKGWNRYNVINLKYKGQIICE